MTFQTLLNTFVNHPAIQALGWALLHFIWQGAVLAALFSVAIALTRRAQAGLRYAIGCIVMLLMPAVFVVTVLQNEHSQAPPPSAQHSIAFRSDGLFPDGSAVIVPASSRTILPVSNVSFLSRLHMLPGWIVCLWLAGLVALSMYTAVGWLRVQQLKQRGAEPANQVWLEAMESLMRRLRVSGAVRLYMSAIADVPTVIGWMRPYILLPISAVTGLDEAQLRAVLAHELAHIRRHDYLVNLLQNATETLLFYHPAVWWVSRRIRQEREHCCDDLAVEVCGDAMVYAGALAQLEELRGSISEPALAATGGDLLARIRRLMGQGNENRRDRIPGSVGAIMSAAIMTAALLLATVIGSGNAPTIHAQSLTPYAAQAALAAKTASTSAESVRMAQVEAAPIPSPQTASAPKAAPVRTATPVQIAQVQPVPAKAKPAQAVSARSADPPLAFDVASVKVTDPRLNSRGFGYFTKYSPDTLTIRDISMWMCVRLAYGVENFRIAGPDSMQNPPFYDIVAKAASPVPESQLRLMLRKLLADRFHLTLHREKKEMSVTALLVAKGGSKMHPTTGAFDPEHGDDAHLQNLGYDNNVHIQRSAGTNGNVRFTFTNASMALFATWLESASSVFAYDKAPVVDLTGMHGRFDWVVESPLVRPPGGGDGAGTPIVADGNTGGVLLDHYKPILERELGLTLGRRKAMVDILVIDHVDKEPTPN